MYCRRTTCVMNIRTKQYKSEPYANRRRVRICSFSERFIKWKMRVVLSATLILRWFILIVQSSTFRRLLCLLHFRRSWLCPEARFSPMHPLRLPICPKSFSFLDFAMLTGCFSPFWVLSDRRFLMKDHLLIYILILF